MREQKRHIPNKSTLLGMSGFSYLEKEAITLTATPPVGVRAWVEVFLYKPITTPLGFEDYGVILAILCVFLCD